MSIESYSFVEHFDYMKNFIPQPFFISCDSVCEIVKNGDDEYVIKTNKGNYSLTKKSLKKLVDVLGVKVKLLSAVCNETDVIDLALPIIDKLFKCFADCFVFYAHADDVFNIIDLNSNDAKGEEGTKYENGPSPWKGQDDKQFFTCFVDFLDRLEINADSNVQVKSDELMPNANTVVISLFKPIESSPLQPMLVFKSKFSDMDGFTDIHPALYDSATNITITFPMNYGSKNDFCSFDYMWNNLLHLHETTDLNDYIFREINELAISEDAPNSLQSFIASLLTDSTLNINQPVKDILNDCVEMMSSMKPSKKAKFAKAIGSLIGWCYTQKHSACAECGHVHF